MLYMKLSSLLFHTHLDERQNLAWNISAEADLILFVPFTHHYCHICDVLWWNGNELVHLLDAVVPGLHFSSDISCIHSIRAKKDINEDL